MKPIEHLLYVPDAQALSNVAGDKSGFGLLECWKPIGAKWLIERRLHWQEDASRKVVSLNPGASEEFFS